MLRSVVGGRQYAGSKERRWHCSASTPWPGRPSVWACSLAGHRCTAAFSHLQRVDTREQLLGVLLLLVPPAAADLHARPGACFSRRCSRGPVGLPLSFQCALLLGALQLVPPPHLGLADVLKAEHIRLVLRDRPFRLSDLPALGLPAAKGAGLERWRPGQTERVCS